LARGFAPRIPRKRFLEIGVQSKRKNACKMLEYIVGALFSLLLMATLFACKNSFSRKSSPVAVEPFVCPRCGLVNMTVVVEAGVAPA
jgi:hypothetical protein